MALCGLMVVVVILSEVMRRLTIYNFERSDWLSSKMYYNQVFYDKLIIAARYNNAKVKD